MQVLIPESAPFTDEQRAWLNGFVAGLLGMERALAVASLPIEKSVSTGEAFPWHDPTLALEERMKLAQDRPIALQMMAAMGQLDCGQCGYLCKTYSEAIAGGTETDLGKCVPGGRATAKKLKELVAQAGDFRRRLACTRQNGRSSSAATGGTRRSACASAPACLS